MPVIMLYLTYLFPLYYAPGLPAFALITDFRIFLGRPYAEYRRYHKLIHDPFQWNPALPASLCHIRLLNYFLPSQTIDL